MDTLKGSIRQFFNFSALSQNFSRGLTGPNLSIESKINVNKKADMYLILKIILIIFLLKDLGGLGLTFAVCVLKCTEDATAEKIISKNVCLNCSSQVKLLIHSR